MSKKETSWEKAVPHDIACPSAKGFGSCLCPRRATIEDLREEIKKVETDAVRGVIEEISPYDLAKLFHDSYEELAPSFGYKTREESRVDFEQLPTANKKLMLATAKQVLGRLSSLSNLKEEE